MKKHPLISVIIPTYNYGSYIGKAIESVLAQNYQPLEIIVIDDGSTDNTQFVLAPYQQHINYHYQENKGVVTAMNQGLELAKGNFIAFLDADDSWMPNKLALQVKAFQQHPEVALVFGHLASFFSEELSQNDRTRLECPQIPKPGFHKDCLLAKKNVFEKIGIFDPTYKFGDFIRWWQKAKEANVPYLMLPETVAKRRIHNNNMTIRHRKAYRLAMLRLVQQVKRNRVS